MDEKLKETLINLAIGIVIVILLIIIIYFTTPYIAGGKSGFMPWGGRVPEWKYKFYPGKIILGHSMNEYGDQIPLSELKEKCELYADCKGYDSLGQLIDYIPPRSAWTTIQSSIGGKIQPNEGTYLKRAVFRGSNW